VEFCRDGNGSEETDLTEPLVTFPDTDTPPPVNDAVTLAGGSPSQLSSLNSLNNLHHSMSPPMNIPSMPNLPAGQETMKFEQKKMTSASKTKVSDIFLPSYLQHLLSITFILIIVKILHLILKIIIIKWDNLVQMTISKQHACQNLKHKTS